MYLDFYKLHLKPFPISTDPRFLWLGEKHQEALAVLKYGILDNKGFLLLTGDVGTGKTTLLNALIDSLGDDVLVALITDPGLAKMDFFNFVADSFGMNRNFKSKGEFLIFLKNYLLDIYRQNKQALLIIDECQHLNQKLLEEVRLLSNIEKVNTKLINIFFVGQNEFNDIILRPRNRAIRQRITINYNISALSESETDKYIRFRLRVAGSKEEIFTPQAIKAVFKFSNGYPRLINIICDQALLTGYVKEKIKIDEKIVTECADELKISHGNSIRNSRATPEALDEKPVKPSLLEITTGEAADKNRRQISRPLLIAFIVVLIIWFGLVAIFFVNQRRTDGSDIAATRKNQGYTANTVVDPQTTVAVKMDSASNVDNRDIKNKPLPERSIEPVPPNKTKLPTLVAVDGKSLGQPSVEPTAKKEKPQPPIASTGAEQTVNQISLEQINEKFGIYPEIQFGFNSNNLDSAAYELLDVISQFCLQNPETIIILRGYTDRSGVRAYNLKLSEFRADMVKTYLVGRGVKDQSISTIAVGPDEEGPGGTKVPYDDLRRKVVIEIISPNAG